MIDPKELAEEQSKMRILRAIVDLTAAILRQGNLTTPEAIELIRATKKGVLQLFPDREEAYDLIYRPRFERIIRERLEEN
ncbi:MAG: hypothetical protein JSW07_14610 [bacterium]|nr:MAG: hypothetical protein JSW07_14610 [bacterium]